MAKKMIGILGDGQLARMSAMAATKLGYQVHFFGQNPDGPCANLGPFTKGDWNDSKALKDFASAVDVITLENEFIAADILKDLENFTALYPSAKCFEKIENKFIEKKTFEQLDIPVPAYAFLNNFDRDLEKFIQQHGFPVMLKSSKGGYDGYGNCLAKNFEEAKRGYEQLGGTKGREIIVEQGIDFEREVAVTVARNTKGEMVVYPVCDTIQENHMCNLVAAPSTISEELAKRIQYYAQTAMSGIDAVGVFSFEFFITKDARVLLNESAPRPHNSAHYTMDACECGQFENHIRAIVGEKLGNPSLKFLQSMMLNILGTQNGKACFEGDEDYRGNSNIFFHIYGKTDSRIGRKMGHVNLVGSDRNELLNIAKDLEEKIRI